jgi:Fe2+ transport system protein FeoA
MKMKDKEKGLSEIELGERCSIASVMLTGAARQRLSELGFLSGARVECLGKSPQGDPRAYLVLGCVIALRQSDAEKIRVIPDSYGYTGER